MTPETRPGTAAPHSGIEFDGDAQARAASAVATAAVGAVGAEETLFDYEEDRGYDLGVGD
jgi:hypothetical protein